MLIKIVLRLNQRVGILIDEKTEKSGGVQIDPDSLKYTMMRGKTIEFVPGGALKNVK